MGSIKDEVFKSIVFFNEEEREGGKTQSLRGTEPNDASSASASTSVGGLIASSDVVPSSGTVGSLGIPLDAMWYVVRWFTKLFLTILLQHKIVCQQILKQPVHLNQQEVERATISCLTFSLDSCGSPRQVIVGQFIYFNLKTQIVLPVHPPIRMRCPKL